MAAAERVAGPTSDNRLQHFIFSYLLFVYCCFVVDTSVAVTTLIGKFFQGKVEIKTALSSGVFLFLKTFLTQF
jgi:hypothetical protein